MKQKSDENGETVLSKTVGALTAISKTSHDMGRVSTVLLQAMRVVLD